jgi:regulator of sigma E protease
MILTIIIFFIILGVLVFVHELGHFIMAKRAGMAVEEFGFGFPPRLFGIKKGETTYSINWIPLGGFVKIVGEDGGATDNPRSFAAKGFWARLSVLIAGVTMNVILAWVILSVGFAWGLPTVVSEGEQLPAHAKIRDVSVAVVEVAQGSPAEQAGIKVGDRIEKVAGMQMASIEQVQKATADNAGREVAYEIKRGDTVMEKNLTPRQSPPKDEGPLGIALSSVGMVSYPIWMVPYNGIIATFNLVWGTLSAFGTIIGNLAHGSGAGVALTGPVGIARLTGDVAALGVIYLLQFTAVLSVNLAIINAVPFPALDGGRVLFLIIEKIRRKKMQIQAEQIANTIGFALLLLLMVFVTIKDVGHLNFFERIKDVL